MLFGGLSALFAFGFALLGYFLIDVGLFLYKGATLHFSNFTGNIFTLAYEIEIKRISFLNTVVNNFNMLLEDSIFDRGDFGSLKSVVMGGGRFTYGLYEKCKKHLSLIKKVFARFAISIRKICSNISCIVLRKDT